jgi:hypothetical protein
VIKNKNVQENQHVNGYSSDKLLQVFASVAVMDTSLDPMMAQDANVS